VGVGGGFLVSWWGVVCVIGWGGGGRGLFFWGVGWGLVWGGVRVWWVGFFWGLGGVCCDSAHVSSFRGSAHRYSAVLFSSLVATLLLFMNIIMSAFSPRVRKITTFDWSRNLLLVRGVL